MERIRARDRGPGVATKIASIPAVATKRSGLLGLDDAAADGAGAREEVLQLVALAPADVALEGGQVLAEAAEHLQHRLAVVEEDVAPHDRVGGGDPREVAEATGRELDDLLLGR